ncbi:MAG: hypothetical protein CV089_15185 [Nitrospira sp. WS110]|nr:hypothetical protein [Nitrospira sp. WS110]
MPSKDNKKAETARANTRRIIEQAPKILLGLFAITGVAYLAGSIYTRSYFSEFRASWILDEVPTTVYFSQNWIPLLLILFFGYLATTNLASMESQGKATGTTRFKVSVAVVQYGPWLLVGFLIMIPLLSGLRWIMPTIVLSVVAITLLLLLCASTLELLVVRFAKAGRHMDLSMAYLSLAVMAVGLYIVPVQLGLNWARVDKQVSSNLFKVYLRDDEAREYKVLFATGDRLYIFPSAYEGEYPPVEATRVSEVTFIPSDVKTD